MPYNILDIERKNLQMASEQEGFVLWFTGLSGSGKTTLAVALEPELQQRGVRTERLDGDIVAPRPA